MKAQRNTPPANVWEALRRLRNCNKGELAEALGVSRHTLQRWERENAETGGNGKAAAQAASDLLTATLRAAGHSDVLAQWSINWDAIRSIGGKE